MVTNSNVHVIEYLKWYVSLVKSPGFAVLIKGAWGCGKSFLVRQFLKSQEPLDIKHLYVSLYGLSTTSQIDDRIFEQLHPLLASKPARIVGNVFRSVARVTIGVDINGDNKSDGSVNANVPDIDLASILNNAKGRVLVFDDLERSNIEASEVLGYINYFVEQHGSKCIVIANDNEVGSTEESKAKYRRIKEKLIGQELFVHPNLGDAFSAFIEEMQSPEAKALLKENITLAMEVFDISGIQNLRSMRQAFLGLDRLLPVLAKQYRENKEFRNDLLKTYLAFSLETQSGNLRPQDIPNLMEASANNADDEESPLAKIIKKYRTIDLTEPLFGGKQWEHILSDGWIQKGALNNWLSLSSYAKPTDTPDWVQLWHFMDLTQEQFQALEKAVWNKFEAGEYKSIHDNLHVAGMMLFFASEHLIDRSLESIKKTAKEKIQSVMTMEYVVQTVDPNEQDISQDERSGLSYLGNTTEGFSNCLSLARQLAQEKWRGYLPQLGKELVGVMKADGNAFRAAIAPLGNKPQQYSRFPALINVDPMEFINVIMSKTPKERWAIGRALSERYANMSRYTQDLKQELPFLMRLSEALSSRTVGMGLDRYSYRKFNDDYVKSAIRKLESFDPVAIANESAAILRTPQSSNNQVDVSRRLLPNADE